MNWNCCILRLLDKNYALTTSAVTIFAIKIEITIFGQNRKKIESSILRSLMASNH